ncbi:hypothetical protein SeLEV6574_g01811 [Synchytrium endobioticum]|nr:hypothetical protein SeLEV6574_g01811 [Synchytrium endobioticum]
MAAIASCRCLNIKIRLSSTTGLLAQDSGPGSAPPPADEPIFLSNPMGCPATVGIGGITIEHRILITTILKHGWAWIKCINCDTIVYGFQEEIHLKITVDDDNGKLPLGQEVEKLKLSPNYSSAFRIRLVTSSSGSTGKVEVAGLPMAFQTAFENLQRSLLTYNHQKRLEVAARIAEYTATQMAIFEMEQEKVWAERDIIWSRICEGNVHLFSKMNNSGARGSSASLDTVSTSSTAVSPSPTTNDDVGSNRLSTIHSTKARLSPPDSFTTSVSSSSSTSSEFTSAYGSLPPPDTQWSLQRKRSSFVPPSLPANSRIPLLPNPPIVPNASLPPESNSLSSGDSSAPTSPVKTSIPSPPRRIKSALSLSSLNGGSMSSKNLRVTFADQPVELYSRKPADMHQDTQGVFSLDGFEDQVLNAPAKAPLHDEEDEDETDESDADDFVAGNGDGCHSKSGLSDLYSTSLPIHIMSPGVKALSVNVTSNSTCNKQSNEGGAVFEIGDGSHSSTDSQAMTAQLLLDDETIFVAPHVLSASLRASNEIATTFERPSSFRKVGLMC